MADFTMPSLGADMDEGTLLEWLVEPGDTRAQGRHRRGRRHRQGGRSRWRCFADGVVRASSLVEPGTRCRSARSLATMAPLSAEPAAGRCGPPHRHRLRRRPGPAARVRAAPGAPHPPRPARELAARAPRGRAAGVDLATVQRHRPGRHRSPAPTSSRAAAAPASRGPPASRRTPGGWPPSSASTSTTCRPGERTAAGPCRRTSARPAADRRAGPPPRTSPRAAGAEAARREADAPHDRGLMARSKREIPHYYLTATIDLDRGAGLAARAQPGPARRRAAGARGPAAQGDRARRGRKPGAQRLLGRRRASGPAPACTSGSRSRCAAAGCVAPALHDADTPSVVRADGRRCATSSPGPAPAGCAAPS